jgi:serine/threonine-protein kinase
VSQERLAAALSDRYRLERELGAGGMATVYLAQDLKHDRQVAIKVLRPELAAVIGAERFLAEIKTTANLQHPHILPLFDSGVADSFLFYVMPYVAGISLRDRMTREKQLPIAEAVRIASEVAAALDYAHRHGVIHRDIKPENIMLHDGSALVADFGIALAASKAGSRMTETGMSLGTPQYMSPEQAMGERELDARSDIYALGCVTYEMLTGEPPFSGPTAQAIVAKVMTAEPVEATTLRKTIPVHVADAVHGALQKLPADRFGTAAEFAAALGDAAAARPRRTGGPTTRNAAAKESRARIVRIVAFSVLAVAALWGWLRPARPASGIVSWGANVTLPDSLALDPFSNNPEGMPTIALSPDGSKLVFVARHGNRTQLYLRQLADFSVRALEGTEGAIAPFFSPAGDAVAFFAANDLKRVTFADGQVRGLSSILSDPFGGAWLPDGRILVSNRRATQLMVLGANGDSLRAFDCQLCSLPQPLPDGRRTIVTGRSGLNVMDLETGEMAALRRWESTASDDAIRGTMARLDGDGHLLYVGPSGQLYAAPFDAKQGIVTGASVSVAEGVRVESGRGAAQIALSRSGAIAWAQGGVPGEGVLVVADRTGKLDTIPAPAANYNSIDMTPDGRRLVVSVGMATGARVLQVIDVASGRVTPWFSTPTIAGVKWMPDGRRVMYTLDSGTFIADPESSAPPRALALPEGASEVSAMADTASYRAWLDNRGVIIHTDGRPMEQHFGHNTLDGNTPDDRWLVSEEVGASETAIVARSLDGRGRRLVIAGGSRFSQTAWATGGEEFIVVDVGNESVKTAEDRDRSDPSRGRVVQGFYAVRYDPANPDSPFGEPRWLFSAPVADFPGRNYAVGLGGNRFVFKQRSAEPPLREVRLVGNWHARLAVVAR